MTALEYYLENLKADATSREYKLVEGRINNIIEEEINKRVQDIKLVEDTRKKIIKTMFIEDTHIDVERFARDYFREMVGEKDGSSFEPKKGASTHNHDIVFSNYCEAKAGLEQWEVFKKELLQRSNVRSSCSSMIYYLTPDFNLNMRLTAISKT